MSFHRGTVPACGRVAQDTEIVSVLALMRGPGRYVIMSGEIDSRASDGSDGETDAPRGQ